MTALGEVGTVTQESPNAGVKVLMWELADTVIGGTDTVQIDLNDYGATKLLTIDVYDQTTTGSVVVSEAPTTVVSSGVLVVTLGGSDTGAKTIVLRCK